MDDRLLRSRAFSGAVVLALGCLLSFADAADPVAEPAGGANDCSFRLRPQDELWELDTRQIHCGTAPADFRARLRISRFAGRWNWSKSDLDSFLAENRPELRTVFFVHGNRVDREEARGWGIDAYQALVEHAKDEQPLRLVVWSWPSEQIHGLLKDVRLKADRTGPAGFQLAWVLNQLDPNADVGLLGFSYGARIITGALHVLAGGKLDGYKLDERKHPDRRPARVVLMAAALDNDWLLPDRYHGKAVSQMDQLLLLNNSCDRALKRYHWVDPCSSSNALGYWGLAAPHQLGAERRKIRERDVCCVVGSVHELSSYMYSPQAMGAAWSHLSSEVAAPTAELAKAVD